MSTVTDSRSPGGFGPSLLTLIRKELYELALPAVALVFCALIVAGMDLLYNRYYPQYHGQGLALTIWLVLSIAIAFLGGGAVIAREGRQRLIFLTAWPQSRARLWLVKSVISFLLTMAVIAAGFGLCLGLGAQLGPKYQPNDVADAAGALSWALPLCFALGLMWSGLIGSVLGAGALGFATGCVLVGAGVWFFTFYLPKYWGPYVGTIPQGDWVQYASFLVFLAVVLLAGATAFIRLPVLETGRRVRWALGLLLGLTFLGGAVFTGWTAVSQTPSFDHAATAAGLTADGNSLYLTTRGTRSDSGGLWLFALDGGRPRLVCRAGGAFAETSGDALVLRWDLLGHSYWAVTVPAGKLRRLQGEPITSSPDGRYWLTMEQPGVVVRDEEGRALKVIEGNYGELVFSPDNGLAYYYEAQEPVHSQTSGGRLLSLDLARGQTSELLRAPAPICPHCVSPDGQWLAIRGDRANGDSEYSLLNLRTRRQLSLGELSPFFRPFVTNRYLWCRQRDSQTHKVVGTAVVEMPSGRVVRRLGADTLRGEPLAPLDRPGVPYVVISATTDRRPFDANAPQHPRKLWLANLDGSGLRLLREETRAVLGMAADGRLVLWDRPNVVQWGLAMSKDSRLGRHFVSWDPITNQEKLLLTLPRDPSG